MNKNIGVYAVICIITGDEYIGSTAMGFKSRWAVHQSVLKHGKHFSKKLQDLYYLYGSDNIIYSILEIVENRIDIKKREQHYLDTRKPTLNVCPYSDSSRGRKLTEIHKERLSISNKMVEKHKLTRKGLAPWNKGKTMSDNTRRLMSLARMGVPNIILGKKITGNGSLYNSMAEASKVLNIPKSCIHRACNKFNGKSMTHGVVFNYI